MLELIILQFNHNVAMQQAIVKNKVGEIISVINNHALLSCLKTEAFTQFKHELLKMGY